MLLFWLWLGFTHLAAERDVDRVFSYINKMFVEFDTFIDKYFGEIVKRTGDGVMAIFGLEGSKSKAPDR